MQWKREKLLFHHTLERDIFLSVYSLSPVSLDGLCGIKLHVRCALGLIRIRGDPAVKNIAALEGQRSILFMLRSIPSMFDVVMALKEQSFTVTVPVL